MRQKREGPRVRRLTTDLNTCGLSKCCRRVGCGTRERNFTRPSQARKTIHATENKRVSYVVTDWWVACSFLTTGGKDAMSATETYIENEQGLELAGGERGAQEIQNALSRYRPIFYGK